MLVEPCLPVIVARAADKVEVGMGVSANPFPKCSSLETLRGELLIQLADLVRELLDPGGLLLELLARSCVDSSGQLARLDLIYLHLVDGRGFVLNLSHRDSTIWLLLHGLGDIDGH